MKTIRIRRDSLRSPASSAGLSLIEVLVSLLVLGFGLLGLAMLQTTNLRLTQSSNSRTVATNLANEMLDQLRRDRMFAANYAGTYLAAQAQDANCAAVDATTPAARMARFACAMKQKLGDSASGVVAVDRATGKVSVQIEWGDARRWNPLAPTTTFRLESQL
jgi:type IV pilus assembly protein PilV